MLPPRHSRWAIGGHGQGDARTYRNLPGSLPRSGRAPPVWRVAAKRRRVTSTRRRPALKRPAPCSAVEGRRARPDVRAIAFIASQRSALLSSGQSGTRLSGYCVAEISRRPPRLPARRPRRQASPADLGASRPRPRRRVVEPLLFLRASDRRCAVRKSARCSKRRQSKHRRLLERRLRCAGESVVESAWALHWRLDGDVPIVGAAAGAPPMSVSRGVGRAGRSWVIAAPRRRGLCRLQRVVEALEASESRRLRADGEEPSGGDGCRALPADEGLHLRSQCCPCAAIERWRSAIGERSFDASREDRVPWAIAFRPPRWSRWLPPMGCIFDMAAMKQGDRRRARRPALRRALTPGAIIRCSRR